VLLLLRAERVLHDRRVERVVLGGLLDALRGGQAGSW